MRIFTRTGVAGAAAVIAALLVPTCAYATVDGYPPSALYKVNRLLGSVSNTGGSLTQYCFSPYGNGLYNCLLLPEKSAPKSMAQSPAFLFPQAVAGIRRQAADHKRGKIEPPRAVTPQGQHCGWMGQGKWHSNFLRSCRQRPCRYFL